MKIVVPMAGTGNRFVEKGYPEPKPLIVVNNKRVIQYVLDMFGPEDEFVFICNDKHLETTKMRSVLLELRPGSKIVSMPQHKKGPVYTVQAAYDFIDAEEEVLVSYCDSPWIWDRRDFTDHLRKYDMDGCVLTHTGFHPHTLSKTKMAFVREAQERPFISEIKEKACYTDNPQNEHASTGAYYFRSGGMLKKYFGLTMERDINYKGEYYVTLVYNLLIEDGLKVGYYDATFATSLGTPEDVENFESWVKILDGGQVKNADDALNCYRYWKSYHERFLHSSGKSEQTP